MNAKISAIASLATILAAAFSAQCQTTKMKSSEVLVDLAQKWVQAYTAKHSELKIEVLGAPTATVFEDLQAKKADLANVTRHIRYKEAEACAKALGSRPVEYKTAIDGVAVYVNSANPLKDLTVDQLHDIFAGTIKNWKELGGADEAISLYTPPQNSAAYESFKDQVLNGRDPVEGATKTAAVLNSVANDKNGIGFGMLAQLVGIRTIAMKRAPSSTPVLPTEGTIVDQTYPLARYLYLYLNPAVDKEPIHGYVDWIRSEDGQKIAKESGFYSLPASVLSKEEKR
jgi:phosphate transport system substrate-binding protein